jgi:hypothetical protein
MLLIKYYDGQNIFIANKLLALMVIVSSDIYQDPRVRGKWIFEKSNNRLEALTPNFGMIT